MEKVYNSILKRLERDFGGKPHFPICKKIQDSYYEPIPDDQHCLYDKRLFDVSSEECFSKCISRL